MHSGQRNFSETIDFRNFTRFILFRESKCKSFLYFCILCLFLYLYFFSVDNFIFSLHHYFDLVEYRLT